MIGPWAEKSRRRTVRLNQRAVATWRPSGLRAKSSIPRKRNRPRQPRGSPPGIETRHKRLGEVSTQLPSGLNATRSKPLVEKGGARAIKRGLPSGRDQSQSHDPWPATASRPSGLTSTDHTLPARSQRRASSPEGKRHSRTLSSVLPVSAKRPSGVKATDVTQPWWCRTARASSGPAAGRRKRLPQSSIPEHPAARRLRVRSLAKRNKSFEGRATIDLQVSGQTRPPEEKSPNDLEHDGPVVFAQESKGWGQYSLTGRVSLDLDRAEGLRSTGHACACSVVESRQANHSGNP